MRCLSWGDAASPARLLLVHGWMDNAASFGLCQCKKHTDEAPAALGLGARLAHELGAYVVAPDLIGHGRSDHLRGGMYDCSVWALQLFKFTHLLGWHEGQPFAVVGHSMGQVCDDS